MSTFKFRFKYTKNDESPKVIRECTICADFEATAYSKFYESFEGCTITKFTDPFNQAWIIKNAVEVTSRYEDGILTLRGLHYQLFNIGMTNDTKHYKRVVCQL